MSYRLFAEGPIFGDADTTTPRRVEQWVQDAQGNFHWKVVAMGTYQDCLQRIRILRNVYLASVPSFPYPRMPPPGVFLRDAADFQLVKQY